MGSRFVGRVGLAALLGALGPSCAIEGAEDGAVRDEAPGAADAEAGPAPDAAGCVVNMTFELGSSEGHPEPLRAGAGEARAGRLGEGDVPVDPRALSLIAAGDYVLANDRVALIVEALGPSDLYHPWGGAPVGLGKVLDGRLTSLADFNEMILGISAFGLEPTGMGILADGSEGGAAVLRVAGHPSRMPFIEDLSRAFLPQEYGDLSMAIDYVLEPEAEHVDVRFSLVNPGTTTRRVAFGAHALFQAKRMPLFVPDVGFAFPQNMEYPWVAFADARGTSYAWQAGDGPLELIFDVSGASLFTSPSWDLPACSSTETHFGRLTLGGPGLEGVLEALARVGGQALRVLTGTVRDGNGAPASSVRVHAESSDGSRYLTRTLTAADGTYALHLPAGEAVRLTAFRRGDRVLGPVPVGASRDTQDLTLAPTGALRITVRDAVSLEPLPARVQVLPQGVVPRVPRHFGEPSLPGGRIHVEFPPDGTVELRVPVGLHRVVVSRGFEYTLYDNTVDVAADAVVDVPAELQRVVETPGILCADFHVHTTRSPDSPDDATFKVAAAAGDGLEIPVRSDHEFVGDFEPAIAAMGLTEFAFGVSSLELTTFTWGHFGVFPLEADHSLPNGGAPPWVDRSPLEVFRAVRGRPEEPVIIINHPRTEFGGVPLGREMAAYFTAAGYDPTTGTVEDPEMWDENFSLVEVFNSSSFERSAVNVADWFSLLRHGRRVFAVGSSDSHGVLPSAPVGYPRTCLSLGVDDAPSLRAGGGADLVRDTALRGAMVVNGGIQLDARTVRSGVGPGGTEPLASETEAVLVRVQAPCWIDVRRLETWVDGVRVEVADIAPDGVCTPLRFEGEVTVPVAPAGSWVVFHAAGQLPLDPVLPGEAPFGVTNPIFFTR